MTLIDFAWKNITRDTKTYLYYFMNCAFSVIVFFLFSSLAQHPALNGIDAQSAMGYTLTAAEVVSVCFSLIFISYSVKNFLKAREKQFGIIVIHGGSKKQINKLTFYENIIIGLSAIIAGILFGLLFFKIFLSAAEKIVTGIELDFYFPVTAILTTIIIMGIVFFAIAYIAPKLIRKEKVIHLVKAEEMAEVLPNIKWGVIIFLVSCMCFVISFITADQIDAMNIVLLLSIGTTLSSGTYTVLYGGISLFISVSKKKGSYYQGTNLILLSDIMNKIRTNLQMMTLSAILYGISFFAIILMISSTRNVKELTRTQEPYAFCYQSWSDQADTQGNVALIKQKLQNQPGYKTGRISFWDSDVDEIGGDKIMSVSMYNQIADFLGYSEVELEKEEAMAVAGTVKDKKIELAEKYKEICQQQGYYLKQVKTQPKLISLTGYYQGITVVSDEVFRSVKNQMTVSDMYVFHIDNWTLLEKESTELKEYFRPLIDNQEATLLIAYSDYKAGLLDKNLVFYIGSILCFSFLLGVTSFTYSRLYSSLEKECEHYRGIVKMGLSKKELKNVLNRYLNVLMWVPFAVAILYMWGGILVLEKVSVISNAGAGVICTVVYIVLYAFVVYIIKRMYRNKVMMGVYERNI